MTGLPRSLLYRVGNNGLLVESLQRFDRKKKTQPNPVWYDFKKRTDHMLLKKTLYHIFTHTETTTDCGTNDLI